MKTARTTPEQSKALVLEAFDTLFNKRDYDAASHLSAPAALLRRQEYDRASLN